MRLPQTTKQREHHVHCTIERELRKITFASWLHYLTHDSKNGNADVCMTSAKRQNASLIGSRHHVEAIPVGPSSARATPAGRQKTPYNNYYTTPTIIWYQITPGLIDELCCYSTTLARTRSSLHHRSTLSTQILSTVLHKLETKRVVCYILILKLHTSHSDSLQTQT
jgi:hypothetical protein